MADVDETALTALLKATDPKTFADGINTPVAVAVTRMAAVYRQLQAAGHLSDKDL